MARKIEYRNEFGVMFTIVNGVRRVYQDIAAGSYTWINTWIDGRLVGSIETKQQRLILNLLPKDDVPVRETPTITIPF
jgi:hypothetical protein